MSIEVKNVSYKYSKGTTFEITALNNINLEIKKSEFIGLIGHTGSGKSTLIQLFNALLSPTEGNIIIDGVDIHSDKKNYKKIRQKVGLVFQYPEHQLFETRVFDDIAFGPKSMGLSTEEIKIRVDEAMEVVGLSKELYDKSPFELSGGQKRRVAIAGVLSMKPEILILDEPTAGLDPKGRDEILGEVKKMHEQLKLTIILVSHSMEDISRLVDRIFVMNKGEVVAMGTPSQVFSGIVDLYEIGLALPLIKVILDRLSAKGFNVRTDLFNVEDAAAEIVKALFVPYGESKRGQMR